MIIKSNPGTLETNLSILNELEIEFDFNDLNSFMFEFALRITEREGFKITDSEYYPFFNFIRENYMDDFRECAVFFRQKQEEEDIKEYGEEQGELRPTRRIQLKPYKKDMEREIETYWLNPLNNDRLDKFEKYKCLRNLSNSLIS